MHSHSIVGIYELWDRIAYICLSFGFVFPEEYVKDKRTPSYALLDVICADFSEHKQAYLAYSEREIFTAFDAVFYEGSEHFFLNTKYYEEFGI